MRFNDEYITSNNKNFLYELDNFIRKAIIFKFISNESQVIELGSGVGNNQIIINKLFPYAEQTASDWSSSSLLINKEISKLIKKIRVEKFNMVTLEGWKSLK